MRYLFAVLAVAALSTTFLIARGEETPAKNAKSLKTYTVTVVEFHLKSNAEPTAALSKIAEDFDKLSAGGDVSLVETVKVSVLEQHPTSVLFGKTMQVLSGVAQTQAGKQRSYKQHSLGTHLTVSAEPVEDQVLLKIKYEAMRIAGELKEELPPDFATTNVDSSALLKIGDRIVLAGDSAEGSTFLLVSVNQ